MGSKQILIVDDEAIVRESIRDWLKDAGYQVLTAESGEEALALKGRRAEHAKAVAEKAVEEARA